MGKPTTYQKPRKPFPWKAMWSFIGFMCAVAFVTLVFTFYAESNSCERQQAPRESANARRLVVNEVVKVLQREKLGTEEQRLKLAIQTERIQALPDLDCGLIWPDTE